MEGVIKNFHYESLHNRLGKMGLLLSEGRYFGMEDNLAIRYSSQNIGDVIKAAVANPVEALRDE